MPEILKNIKSPVDLRKLRMEQLPALADEIRKEILDTVSKTGGHLASSLGAVELAIAVHYVFATPRDKVIWDVGHQTYAHKLLTGRAGRFRTLRQLGGISGFPNRDESPEYDLFTSGHASTSISTALGLVAARDLKKTSEKVIAVIGDASLGGGMAFEALNHVGHAQKDMIVILNDNELSISHSVGALSKYLNRIISGPAYNKIRKDVEKLVKRIPRFGFRAYRAARKLEEGLKNLLIPGMLFEEMGFRYFGPIDGNNLQQLIWILNNLKDLREPILIHVLTKKGKGYELAEGKPETFHGTGPFDLSAGDRLLSGAAPDTFTAAFRDKIAELGTRDPAIIGITAAMADGTGFDRFAREFPERFFDVGIAEEHAVGFGAGLARGGFKPVVAVYSTFMQRGYDQIVHDVCLQRLPVTFCLDRAGIVGEDGPTHHGMFDIPYLRHIPGLTFMAPSTPAELAAMLEFSVGLDGPCAIRYPKGKSALNRIPELPIKMGRAETIKPGKDIVIISIGSMADMAVRTAALLADKGIDAMVINARFIKPLDEETLLGALSTVKKAVTLEDGVLDGGFGSAVLELAERAHIPGIRLKRLGFPDRFIEHGRRDELFSKYNLTPQAICDVIIQEVSYGKNQGQ
ncbi:MAG: 1-deoxy-D-xylulose-5-phosphate synthase [Candidatus Omnitrophica bacterium]|nr:1-deoxy-D-xylulose-5-phosphate synthase [Candidatus Omnitrophota bacterium]